MVLAQHLVGYYEYIFERKSYLLKLTLKARYQMDLEYQKLASELIDLKRQIMLLTEQEKTLKETIKPLVRQNGFINLPTGKVYYSESKGARRFIREDVLDYLRKNFGEEIANQVDADCTQIGEPQQTVYIKLAGNSI